MCQLQGGVVVRISETDRGFIWPYFNETFLKVSSIVFSLFYNIIINLLQKIYFENALNHS